jgi:hypothetical protein
MVDNNPRPVRTLALAGLVATWVALTVGYWLPAIGLPRMDIALLNGNLLVPESSSVGLAWTVGAIQTLGLGVLLGIAYGRVMRHRLPGPPAMRGAIWGCVIGIGVGMVLMPLLYGAGIFGVRWAPTMPLAIALWHLAWGTAVGITERL